MRATKDQKWMKWTWQMINKDCTEYSTHFLSRFPGCDIDFKFTLDDNNHYCIVVTEHGQVIKTFDFKCYQDGNLGEYRQRMREFYNYPVDLTIRLMSERDGEN